MLREICLTLDGLMLIQTLNAAPFWFTFLWFSTSVLGLSLWGEIIRKSRCVTIRQFAYFGDTCGGDPIRQRVRRKPQALSQDSKDSARQT